MVHPGVVNKATASKDGMSGVMQVDVRKLFTNKWEFNTCEHMLYWIYMEASKLVFGVVIERSDFGFDRRSTFVTMRCERSGSI